jgi:hypothetical protein
MMRRLLAPCFLLLFSLGCASTSTLSIGEDANSYSDECLYYPYTCLNSIDPWYGVYPYDLWYYDVDDDDYWDYPPDRHYYPYYLWRHRHPRPKRPWFAWRKPNQAGERIAHIRQARREAREHRISNLRQARQRRIEVRRERANSFRSNFQRSRPSHGFRGGFGGVGRR